MEGNNIYTIYNYENKNGEKFKLTIEHDKTKYSDSMPPFNNDYNDWRYGNLLAFIFSYTYEQIHMCEHCNTTHLKLIKKGYGFFGNDFDENGLFKAAIGENIDYDKLKEVEWINIK